MIVACCGPQRSGKTLMASMIAREMKKEGLEVYTNMEAEEFVHISSLMEVPLLDLKPKVLLLDEAHSIFNSRAFKGFQGEQAMFFNILGKCNCILLLTCINVSMIDKVIREQIDYLILARGDEKYLNYRMVDCHLERYADFSIEKTDKFWKSIEGLYDTTQVPDIVDMNLSDKESSFTDRIREARLKLKRENC